LGWAEELAGPLHAEAAAATGLAAGTPVAFGTIDALSEAISVGVVKAGDLMLMYGSTTFFVLVQDQPTPDTRVWSVCGAQAGQFNLAAGMSTTGSLTRWFKDEFARDLDAESAYANLFDAAAEVRAGSEGLLVLPYFSGERTPINDTQASGVIAGLNLSHTRAQMFRAVLEGVGFGVRHNLETFADIGADVRRMVAVGGGAQTRIWLQIVSDITGVTQVLPQVTVGAAYGDAFLAGRAAGLLQPQDINAWVRVEREIAPQPQNRAIYDAMYIEYLRLYLGSKDVVHRLKAITAGHF
jgi:xylulokinase